MVTCQHCGKPFTTTSHLNRHQKTTKSCLKIQKETETGLISELRKKIALSEMHKEIALSELRKEIQLLRSQNEQLLELVAKGVSRSTTTNFNFPPLTQKHLEDNAQFLSLDHVKKGFQGYAQYALDFPLKGLVTCTDYSRRKVKYVNEEGQSVTDPDMTNLCTNLFSAIRSRNQELTSEYMQEMKEKADSGQWDRNDIQDLVFEAITRNGDVASIANGDRPEAVADFVKWVCSGLTISKHDISAP